MLSKAQEQEFLESLEKCLDITDVYFCKGKLYVINAYDVEDVEEFLDETSWGADVELVEVDSFDPFDTVNS